MKLIFKIKSTQTEHKAERVDFFNKSFVVFYEEGMGCFKNVNSFDIEWLINSNGDVLYPNISYLEPFAESIIKTYVDAGKTQEEALEYFKQNYT